MRTVRAASGGLRRNRERCRPSRRGGQKEGQKHDAGFAAAAAPGAEEQDADEGAEDDFSGNRENLVDLFQAGDGEDRQKEHADLHAADQTADGGLAVKRRTNSSVTAMKMRPNTPARM